MDEGLMIIKVEKGRQKAEWAVGRYIGTSCSIQCRPVLENIAGDQCEKSLKVEKDGDSLSVKQVEASLPPPPSHTLQGGDVRVV